MLECPQLGMAHPPRTTRGSLWDWLGNFWQIFWSHSSSFVNPVHAWSLWYPLWPCFLISSFGEHRYSLAPWLGQLSPSMYCRSTVSLPSLSWVNSCFSGIAKSPGRIIYSIRAFSLWSMSNITFCWQDYWGWWYLRFYRCSNGIFTNPERARPSRSCSFGQAIKNRCKSSGIAPRTNLLSPS